MLWLRPFRVIGDVRNPGHVGIEEIRGGAGGGGGDLLGLLLLFPLAAHVAKGAELGAPSGAEAGASAGPDELSVKRPGHCSPTLRPQPPPPHPCRHCSASRCIKDLNPSHRAALLTLPPLPPFGLGAPLHAGCFLTDRASLPDRVPLRVQAPITPKGPSSESTSPYYQ